MQKCLLHSHGNGQMFVYQTIIIPGVVRDCPCDVHSVNQCWPPTSQREVVQNEQRRYTDIVTVMKGRQPVKTGRKYTKKKLEHRTQSTHSTNMSGKLGLVLVFKKNIQSQRIYPNSITTWWVVFCGLLRQKRLAKKRWTLHHVGAEFLGCLPIQCYWCTPHR